MTSKRTSGIIWESKSKPQSRQTNSLQLQRGQRYRRGGDRLAVLAMNGDWQHGKIIKKSKEIQDVRKSTNEV